MRRTIMAALLVLALALILCWAGTSAVDRAVGKAEKLLESAEHAADIGDIQTARENMRALRQHWDDEGRVLELITSHDALFDARSGIEDALLCLEQGEKAEFFRAAAEVSVQLERLRVTEALRFANLY